MTDTISEALKPGTTKDLTSKRAAIVAFIAKAEKLRKKIEAAERKAGDLRMDGALASMKKGQQKFTAKERKAEMTKLSILIAKAQEELSDVQREISQGSLSPATLKKMAVECSQILKMYQQTNKVLFRGFNMNSSAPKVFAGRPREDRRPSDSDPAAQKIFDAMLQKLKIAAQRSNSLFTCSDYLNASGYGNVYVIFPKNGFKFSYSKSRDLVIHHDTVPSILNKNGQKFKMLEKFMIAWKLRLQDVDDDNDDDINRWGQQDTVEYFFQAVRDSSMWNEFDDVLERIGMYLSPPANIMSIESQDIVAPDMAKMVKKYQPTNKDLPKALKSGVEVLILGEYYAVEQSVAKQVLKYFGIKSFAAS